MAWKVHSLRHSAANVVSDRAQDLTRLSCKQTWQKCISGLFMAHRVVLGAIKDSIITPRESKEDKQTQGFFSL